MAKLFVFVVFLVGLISIQAEESRNSSSYSNRPEITPFSDQSKQRNRTVCIRDSGIFAHPDDCHKYVFCIHGRVIVKTCPPGQVYYENSGCLEENSCPERYSSQEKTTAVCGLERNPGPCEGYFDRYYFNKQSGNCEKFTYGGCYGNANNFLTLNDCKKLCVIESESNEDNEYEDFHCRESGRYMNPNDCNSYIECSVFPKTVEMQLVQCPSEQHYSAETKQCEDKCIAQCDQSLACTCGWPYCVITCREPNGIFPLPSNCKLYIVCRNSRPHVKRCREGKAFDPESRQCVNIEETNCDKASSNDILSILLRRRSGGLHNN